MNKLRMLSLVVIMMAISEPISAEGISQKSANKSSGECLTLSYGTATLGEAVYPTIDITNKCPVIVTFVYNAEGVNCTPNNTELYPCWAISWENATSQLIDATALQAVTCKGSYAKEIEYGEVICEQPTE